MRARQAIFVPLALALACSERPLGDTDTATLTDPATTTTTAPTTTAPTTTAGAGIPFDPYSLEVADFDGDGHLDLLIMGIDDGGVAGQLLRGHGDGSFALGTDPLLEGASAYPAIGQLDQQSGIDVMIAQPDGVAWIYRHEADGFVAYDALQSPSPPRTHTVLDFDGDGRNDVLALWHGDDLHGLTLHRSQAGAPAWALTTTELGELSAFAPRGLLVGRLDGDLLLDALLYDPEHPGGFLRVLGGADRHFHAPVFQVPELAPTLAGLGDLNEDGHLDILAVEPHLARLSFVPGNGQGEFTLAATLDLPPGFVPQAIDLEDLDRDGHLDILAVDPQVASLYIWTGHGDGSFDPPQALDLPSGAVRVHAVQLDGDPPLDLVLATFAIGEVTILLNPLP